MKNIVINKAGASYVTTDGKRYIFKNGMVVDVHYKIEDKTSQFLTDLNDCFEKGTLAPGLQKIIDSGYNYIKHTPTETIITKKHEKVPNNIEIPHDDNIVTIGNHVIAYDHIIVFESNVRVEVIHQDYIILLNGTSFKSKTAKKILSLLYSPKLTDYVMELSGGKKEVTINITAIGDLNKNYYDSIVMYGEDFIGTIND